MKILVVMVHPRRDSLTGQVTDAVINSLKVAGHGTELADLYSEDFDPLIIPPNESGWASKDQLLPRSSVRDRTA